MLTSKNSVEIKKMVKNLIAVSGGCSLEINLGETMNFTLTKKIPHYDMLVVEGLIDFTYDKFDLNLKISYEIDTQEANIRGVRPLNIKELNLEGRALLNEEQLIDIVKDNVKKFNVNTHAKYLLNNNNRMNTNSNHLIDMEITLLNYTKETLKITYDKSLKLSKNNNTSIREQYRDNRFCLV